MKFCGNLKIFKVSKELFSASTSTPSRHSKYLPTFNFTYEAIFLAKKLEPF